MSKLLALVAVSLLSALLVGAVSCIGTETAIGVNALSGRVRSGFVPEIREGGSLRVSLDNVCWDTEGLIRAEMTIDNLGGDTLSVTDLRLIIKAVPVDNPSYSRPRLAVYPVIAAGQSYTMRYSDGTHIEFPADDVTRETYLVVLAESDAGIDYGVTFTLPPLSIPRCPD